MGIISTVAGNGTQGYSGDGGAATSAELDVPWGTAVDSSGNLYFSDAFNFRVRKVTPAGVITTVAGNGTPGYSGDGGTATNAGLAPLGVAVDSSGNLYIGDSSNNRVRKVTAATGVITTVAGNGTNIHSGDGGAATNAGLDDPRGIAVDSSGNLYIVETDASRVRKVTATTGIISTVAGNGTQGYSGDGGAATSAELSVSYGVAVDSNGNLYIGDGDNSRIRKVTVATGIISTYAGTGTAGSSGDGGAATSAELDVPYQVAVDSSGNLYIADFGGARVRKVAAETGIITTVAGNGTAGYSGDGALATSAELNGPMGVAIDSSGNLCIADDFNQRVRKVTY